MSIYQPLNAERSEIRILTLLPGREKDALKCTLRVRSLDDAPKFEALSYVWGTGQPSHPVLLNGHEVTVRDSLDGALRGLRRRFRPRQIWADALCINQDDTQEKNTQAPLMARVYRESSQTLAWLGPLAPHMNHFISHSQPWYNATRIWCTAYFAMLPSVATVSDQAKSAWAKTLHGYLLSEKQYHQAIYWERMWTFPEFLLPRKVRMMYGSRTFDIHESDPEDRTVIDSLYLALRGIDNHCINRNDVEGRIRTSSVVAISMRRYVMHFGRPYPGQALFGSAYRECSCRHDYVYALYSLIPELQVLYPVDYGKSVPQLMLETTAYLISRGNCGPMYCVYALYRSSSPSDLVPSWVVDFSHQIRPSWIVKLQSEFLPLVPAPPIGASPNSTILSVATRKIGYCTLVFTLSHGIPQMVEQLQALLIALSYMQSDGQEDQFVFRIARMLMPSWESSDDTKVNESIRTWVTTPSQTLTTGIQSEKLQTGIESYLAGANIIRISDRWFGVATGGVAEGDMVVLHHMEFGPPFVVRPGPSSSGDGQAEYYTLVGIADVEGITRSTPLGRAAVEGIGRTDVEEILLR